jgi:hypothetical protein
MFYVALVCGAVTIVAGGALVAGSLTPFPIVAVLGEHVRTVGAVLLQVGIVIELVAVALHERLTERELRRQIGFLGATTMMEVTVFPGGRL